MSFYKLYPEVAGGWGPNTDFTRILGKSLVIRKFHYEFDGWLGDELLQSSPCYIVTERLANAIRNHELSGCELKAVEVSTSDVFRELYPDRQLPRFAWLVITGTAGEDDFGLDADGRLVVSERAYSTLKTRQLSNCEVSEFG
jgi:hypothetical protein